MAITADSEARQVLAALVQDPRLAELERLPRFDAVQIGLVAAVWTLFLGSSAAYLSGLLPLPLAIALNALAVYAAFTPLHDSTHRAVSSDGRVNDVLGTLAGMLMFPGMTARVYRVLHLEHHRWVGDATRDPDTPLAHSKGPLVPLLLAAPDVVWFHWWVTRLWGERSRQERAEFVLTFVLYAMVHVVFLLSPWAWAFVLLWVVPQRLGVMVTAYCFARIQHPEGTTWSDAPLESTAVISTGPHALVRLAMLGQNDHHIHHLLPHLPWYRYHRVWALADGLLRRQPMPERGVLRGFDPVFLASLQKTRRVRVSAIRDVAEGVRAITLVPVASPGLPGFEAGAHIQLHLPSGRIRHYSLCGDPAGGGMYEIAVKREPQGRGGSVEVHTALGVGAELSIGLPRNHFALAGGVPGAVLVAGGIGVTPLLAMAHTLHRRGTPFTLHICARDAALLPFGQELSALPFADRVRVHLDTDPGTRFVAGRDLPAPGERHHIYMCGPQGFMDHVRTEARALGWPDAGIRSESFGAPAVDAAQDRAFEVELGRSGRTVAVAADMPILDALRNVGVDVPSACLQGVCGSCVVGVVDGEVEHRDAVLSEAQRCEQMCICVSRARGERLVLDL